MSFSIDDVRETFARDIGGCVAGIDAAARTLVAALSRGTLEADASFDDIEDRFHTIYGTTMLVGATSIARAAAELEELSRRGEAALRELRLHQRRARLVAELAVESAAKLEKMLALELDHRRNDAEGVSNELRTGPVDGVRKELDALPSPPAREVAPEEFAFDEGEPSADVSGQDVDGELREVFHAEAQAAVVELERLLPRLLARPDDFATAGTVERLFHTLKGAAATVGLTHVSAVAMELQGRMERALEGDLEVDESFLAGILSGTDRFLSLAGLGPLRRSVLPRSPVASSNPAGNAVATEFSFVEPDHVVKDELLGIFLEEARESVAQLKAQLDALVESANDLAAVSHMERIFHTLKGAATTVGLADVGKIAAALQEQLSSVLEAAAVVDDAFIERLFSGTNRLFSTAGLTDVVFRKASVHAVETRIEVPARVFLSEATQICQRALAIGRELPHVSAERAGDLRAELTRIFHRLKGSALVGSHAFVATEAERLQKAAEGGQLLERELERGVRAVAAALGIELAPPEETSVRSVAESFELLREPVQLIREPALLATMHQECLELLDAAEKILVDLETNDRPKVALEGLLRHYHTLKGAVNTAGLSPTGAELHLVEDFLEHLGERPILPSMRAVASFLFEIQNDVRRQLRQSAEGYVEISLPRVRAAMARVMGGAVPGSVLDSGPIFDREGESRGSVGSAGSGAEGVADRSYIRVATERLDALMNLAGELVVSRSRLMSRVGVLRSLQQELGRSSRRLVDTVDRFRDEHEFSIGSAGGGRPRAAFVSPSPSALTPPDTMQGAPWNAFSDIELDRYDDVNVLSRSLAEITNDVNEMNAQLVRELLGFSDDSDAFGGIVSGIQGEVTRSRMIELDLLFTRLRYPVRDAADRDRKEVRVVCRGERVSLDKTIADALFTPMLHLVRNAVVHGIEDAAARVSRGKPREGVITLEAREQAGQIVIEVRDDGGGLDLGQLRARGAAMHLVAADTPLTDPAIKDLVFASGLSTKATAGAVSGRGVGGDVVRRSVERLNGTIRVDTASGKGTTFTMTLPVTLSITRALLVRQAGNTFAIPLFFSERILDPEEARIVDSAGVRRVRIDETYLPIRGLGDVFQSGEDGPRRGPLLILRVGTERVVLQVDSLVGQEEIVVKGMGDLLTGHPLFAGVTIRGNGELVLILDVPALIDRKSSRVDAEGRLPKAVPVPAQVQAVAPAELDRPMALVEAPVRRQLPQPRADAARQGKRTRVLFVDDSLSVRRVAEKALLSLGVDVTIAVDGADALAKLRDARFDIVFTDLEMPRVHGYDLIRELRFLPAFKDLPIVVVSSRSGKKHQDQARSLGASEYLTKPFSPKTLESMLVRFCGEGAVTAATGERESPEAR